MWLFRLLEEEEETSIALEQITPPLANSEGMALFQNSCVFCHGRRGEGGHNGMPLEGLAARYSLRPRMKPVGGHAFADSGRVTIESLYQSPYRDFFGDSNVEDVGVLQGPLEVQDHYSIFRLDQPFEKAAVSFKQVRRPIRVDIRERKEGVLFAAFLDSLRRARADQIYIDEGVLDRHAAAP